MPYVFPGSTAEFYTVHSKLFLDPRRTDFRVVHYGDYCFRQLQPVDWSTYYEDFPERYFKTPPEMQAIIERYRGIETLEVGGNTKADAKYAWDPYVEAENAENLAFDEVLQRHFDLIIARNSINYMCKGQIKLLLDRTDHFVANTFLVAPEKKVTDREAAVRDDNGFIHHALLLPNDDVATHEFWVYTREDYKALGFTVTPYGMNSALLTYDADKPEKTTP